MVLYRIIAFFLIVLTLQVDALLPESSLHKKHDVTIFDAGKSMALLKNWYEEAKTTFDKVQSCGPRTHLEILSLAVQKLEDYQGCVNATKEVANFEEFFFDLYYYVKFVASTAVTVFKNVIDCRHQSGLFNILNCTVAEFKSSGTQVDEILSRAEDLIADVKEDTDDLIHYIKLCLGRSVSEFLLETHSLIQRC